MSEGLYELLALCARYVFAGLMVLIVARAWRITIVDSRRAKTLRRISPETGIIGELMVMEGDEKARRGMKYKVIREGQIGSARRADIRIRHSSVRRRHAYFLMTEDGLRVRSHAGAPLKDDLRRPVREILMQDGDCLSVGRVQLMLILTQAPEAGRPMRRRRRRDDAFDDTPDTSDDLFDADTLEDGSFENDLFEPEDPLFSGYDAPGRGRRPIPFTMHDDPFAPAQTDASRPVRPRSVRPDARRSGPAFRVEDNPLNRRHPQNPAPYRQENQADDEEMW